MAPNSTMTVTQEEMSDAPLTPTIDGVKYEIDPIRQGKMNEAIRWLRSQWVSELFATTRGIPLPHEVRGHALAEIITTQATIIEVLDSYPAKLYLMSLQIKANGKYLEHDYILSDEFKPETCGTLLDLMLGISRKKKDDGKKADPTTSPVS